MVEPLELGRFISTCRKEKNLTQTGQYQSGRMEFPIVKDTTPNITNPRLYDTA